jgi:uncharacterized protein YtpQ (UPF0354 family)
MPESVILDRKKEELQKKAQEFSFKFEVNQLVITSKSLKKNVNQVMA